MDDPTLYGPLYGLPDPPHPSFEDLASPQEVRRAIDTFMEQQICALGALRNATLLINQLPNEIFVEILLMARLEDFKEVGLHYDQDGVPRTVGTFDWLPMMRVCRRWWAVARSTPRLWRSIDVYRNKKWLDLCISRSADATLELSFHDEDTALVAIPTVIFVTHRISRLLLPGIRDINFKHIFPLLKLQMPNLVEIGLSNFYDSNENEGEDEDEDEDEDGRGVFLLRLRPYRFPALTTLHLLLVDDVIMSWSSALFSNLSFLEITGCIIKYCPSTLTAFLAVLKRCTRLEELRLKETLCDMLDNDTQIRDTKLALPKLRKLVIAMYAVDTPPLMQFLCLPIDVEIIISIMDPGWDGPYSEDIFFQRYIIPPPRSHIAIFHSATHGRILVRENMMHLVAQGALQHHPGITIEYRDHNPHENLSPFFGRVLSAFSDIFINAPIDSLTVYGDIYYTDQEEWSLLFSRLPKLESLTLRCTGLSAWPTLSGKSLADMFRALGEPPLTAPAVPDPDPSQSPLVCPKLRAVEIIIMGDARCSDKDFVNIHRALQLRAKNGAPALRTLWLKFQTKHENEAAFLAQQALATQMFTESMPDGGGRYDQVKED